MSVFAPKPAMIGICCNGSNYKLMNQNYRQTRWLPPELYSVLKLIALAFTACEAPLSSTLSSASAHGRFFGGGGEPNVRSLARSCLLAGERGSKSGKRIQ